MNARSFYNSDVATEHYLGIRWPRAIWQAVLEQAIKDALEGPQWWELKDCRNAEEKRRLTLQIRDAAQDWIDDPLNEPRRFEWVCEQLDLEPSAVRRSIKMRERDE